MVAGLLGIARLLALGWDAPGRDGRATGGVVLALAASMRVVNRIHDRAPDGGTHAALAIAAGLADNDIRVLRIANLADGGATSNEHATKLRGGHT